MTLLPGSLATAPQPARGGASMSSSSAARAEGSRDFASALQGALGGSSSRAERGPSASRGAKDPADAAPATPAAPVADDVDASAAQPQADVQPTQPVPTGMLVPAGLVIPTDLAIPLVQADIDGSAALGVAAAEAIVGADASTGVQGVAVTGGVANGALTGPATDAGADAAAATRDSASLVATGAAVSPTASAAPAAPLPANQQAQGQQGAAQPDVLHAVPGNGVTTPGSAPAFTPTTPASPAAQGATAPLTSEPPVSPVAAAFSSVSADAGEQSDSSHNGSGQPTPGTIAPSVVPTGIATPAVAYAAATANVAASQSAQADRLAQAPLSTQIARPLFSLANAAHGEHVMTISITPDNLGPVTVRAHVGGEGIRVELFAPNDAGRDALRSILPDLKRDLAGSGMTGASLDLSSRNQADSSRDQGQQPGQSGRERASVSALEGAGTGAHSPERTTVPTWYGETASIDVMA